ncbi:UbiA family prenyltransferase [Algirhabdus cladophorae]|uniref:UbiA family prenyltransferase n=1 Tax=Algirhabdus cladophorae TaxID=3377108 RepID=UPI003B84B533
MSTDKTPLVLDVDGTFLKTDMLFECFWAGLGKDPLGVIKTSIRHFREPAVLKAKLAEIATVNTGLMPVVPEVKAKAEAAMAEGREVILASASDQSQVKQLAADHGFSETVFASDGQTNLKGKAKAAALVEAYGASGFDYAGNEPTDMPIWNEARAAIVVGDAASAKTLTTAGKPVEEIEQDWTPRALIKALRPHQYVKNVLLFLPALAAHAFDLGTLALVLLGIAAFSMAASSIYIINDLLDLEADRLHPKKCRRPFAAGTVPIRIGMITYAVLTVVSLSIAASLGPAFLGVILVYIVLSLAYSLKLKRMRWVDIAVLATLYTLRVVAGAAASGVDASVFMLIFIFPVFIALGCVKRMTELALATTDDRLPGRGYGRPDMGDLLNVAGLGTVGALLIFFMYSFSEQAVTLYPTRWILWLALVPLAAWLLRMVRLGYQGKQDYDPIVFAMRDKKGLGLIMITLGLMFYAAGLYAQWFG